MITASVSDLRRECIRSDASLSKSAKKSTVSLGHRPKRSNNKKFDACKAAGLTLPGGEAAHKVFSDQNWQIVIDFEE